MPEIRSTADDFAFSQPSEWILDCQFVEDNAAGLALDALDPDEQIRIATHLSWCSSCAKLVHDTRSIAAYLPFASPVATPSPAAKSKLFDRIEASQNRPVAALTDPAGRTTTIPASTSSLIPDPAPRPRTTPSSPSNKRTGSRGRRFRWEVVAAPLAAVPLMIALAIVGGWALQTQNRLTDQTAQARNLEHENADLLDQVSMLSNGLETAQTRRFDLASTEASIGVSAGGNLVVIADKPWANLSVWNLPSAANGYQVLLETKDGQMQRAGEFSVDPSGDAKVKLELERPIDSYRAIHVRQMPRLDRTAMSDSIEQQDVLWMDMQSSLGVPGGTEANSKAN